MLTIGLTGGIGAGKTAVSRRLGDLGAVIVDSDRLARDVVDVGTSGLAEVVAAFGDGVLAADGTLDRPALGARVFGDDAARRRLEAIIHPRVRQRAAELIAAAPPDAIVVNDVPLLVEVGLAPTYHLVIVVEAGEATRVERLVRGRGMPAAQAHARIAAQAADADRRAVADVVLRNDGTLDDLTAQVDALWRDRLVPYEQNVRHERVAAPGTPVRPDDYPRVAARLRHVLDAEPRLVGDTIVVSVPAERAAVLGPAGFPPLPGPDGATGQVGAGGAGPMGAGGAGSVGAAGSDGARYGSADPDRPAMIKASLEPVGRASGPC